MPSVCHIYMSSTHPTLEGLCTHRIPITGTRIVNAKYMLTPGELIHVARLTIKTETYAHIAE